MKTEFSTALSAFPFQISFWNSTATFFGFSLPRTRSMLGGFSEHLLNSKFTTNYRGTKYINQLQKEKKYKQNKEHIVQCKKLIVAGEKESGRKKKKSWSPIIRPKTKLQDIYIYCIDFFIMTFIVSVVVLSCEEIKTNFFEVLRSWM